MRSVEHRFRLFQERFPDHSTFIVFGRTIEGQDFGPRTVGYWFSRLVKKDDYAMRDRRRLLHHLQKLQAHRGQSKIGGTWGVSSEEVLAYDTV